MAVNIMILLITFKERTKNFCHQFTELMSHLINVLFIACYHKFYKLGELMGSDLRYL